MANRDVWAEIVAHAEMALTRAPALDPLAYRLAQRIVQTNELVARSNAALWTAARIHERGLTELRESVIKASERTWRAAARTEKVLTPDR